MSVKNVAQVSVDNMYDKSLEDFLNYYNNPLLVGSSENQDMYEHVDVLYKDFSFDIKGKKSLKQGGDIQEDYTWIERTNVRGNIGWLKGKATHIVFQYKDGYLFCERKELLEYCKTLFNPPYVSTLMPRDVNKREPYVLYKRPNRKDCIFLMGFYDLITLGKFDNTRNIENIIE